MPTSLPTINLHFYPDNYHKGTVRGHNGQKIPKFALKSDTFMSQIYPRF